MPIPKFDFLDDALVKNLYLQNNPKSHISEYW